MMKYKQQSPIQKKGLPPPTPSFFAMFLLRTTQIEKQSSAVLKDASAQAPPKHNRKQKEEGQ
jgi:hypothetical protein